VDHALVFVVRDVNTRGARSLDNPAGIIEEGLATSDLHL
jgi:hypothetical protein